jgi:hypothetical protein
LSPVAVALAPFAFGLLKHALSLLTPTLRFLTLVLLDDRTGLVLVVFLWGHKGAGYEAAAGVYSRNI